MGGPGISSGADDLQVVVSTGPPGPLAVLVGLAPVYRHGLLAGLRPAGLPRHAVPDLTGLPVPAPGRVVAVLPAEQAAAGQEALERGVIAALVLVLTAAEATPQTTPTRCAAGRTG